MSYFSPYIDESGLHIPSYNDILEDLILQARSIFGEDVYLEPDSQDYQLISIFSLKIYDTLQLLQLVYQSRGPGTAIGASLDGIVKINGIVRKAPTYSTCVCTISGLIGALISGGIVKDVNGYLWDLPATVAIPSIGSIDVAATCQVPGPINASVGEITQIVTPTYGWNSITNNSVAEVGQSVETDSQLRVRQSFSTAQPSRTVLEGTKGAIASITGVTRFVVYENDTSVESLEGLPPHSITVVAEGGDEEEIATAIFNKKGPGCYTHGNVSVPLIDSYGAGTTIKFFRPSYVYVDVVINVKPLAGYTTATEELIKSSVIDFINSISMGLNIVPVSSFWGAALSAMAISGKPTFSITSLTAARHGETQGTDDIETEFNEALSGNIEYVTINLN